MNNNRKDNRVIRMMKPFCSGKDILLVGNGSSLLTEKRGTAIDGFDVVVRMNHGYPRPAYYEYTGKRTDIWVCAFNDIKKQIIERDFFKAKYIVRLNNTSHVHPSLRTDFLTWELKHWYTLKNQLGIEKYPSTGIVTISFFLNFLDIDKVFIVGYDSFKTNNFYHKYPTQENKSAAKWHDSKAEEKFLELLISEERIEKID